MTCYQRHLGWLFESLGKPYEKAQRREVHEAIVELIGMDEDAHCPEIWAALKEHYAVDTKTESAELAADLARRLGS